MKITAFMGSTRKNRNTDTMLKSLIKDMGKYDLQTYYLKDMKINHCIGCYYCGKKGECVFNDDLSQVYKRIDESDVIILASPVYFNSVTSATKTFIDRMQVYWSNKYLLGNRDYKDKFGILLTDGGAEYDDTQFLGVDLVMDHFFKCLNCKDTYSYYVANTDDYPLYTDEKIIEELIEIGNGIENLKPGRVIKTRKEEND
ncbi:MAG: flavodoxin family protein [Tissierellia bacterium]|nr:flavodoxin family protein [Tissierellia bacterium]